MSTHKLDIIKKSGMDLTGLEALAKSHHLALVLVYGSYARGDEREDSDLDLAYLETDVTIDPNEFASLAPRVEVSALRLNTARPELQLACAEEGIALFQAKPDTFAIFKNSARANWRNYRARFNAARVKEREEALPLSMVLERRAMRKGDG